MSSSVRFCVSGFSHLILWKQKLPLPILTENRYQNLVQAKTLVGQCSRIVTKPGGTMYTLFPSIVNRQGEVTSKRVFIPNLLLRVRHPNICIHCNRVCVPRGFFAEYQEIWDFIAATASPHAPRRAMARVCFARHSYSLYYFSLYFSRGSTHTYCNPSVHDFLKKKHTNVILLHAFGITNVVYTFQRIVSARTFRFGAVLFHKSFILQQTNRAQNVKNVPYKAI